MRTLASSAIACLCLLVGGAATEASAASPASTILLFRTMYGVDGPFVGDTNPIRDVIGDELPWAIARFIRGSLNSKGHLVILVRGLVFKDDPSVPADLRGTNDEAEFRGLVSCLTEEGDAVVTKNVITDGFPATPSATRPSVPTSSSPTPVSPRSSWCSPGQRKNGSR